MEKEAFAHKVVYSQQPHIGLQVVLSSQRYRCLWQLLLRRQLRLQPIHLMNRRA